MIMVAICDDDIKVGAELERTLIDIFDGMQLQYSMDVFFNGEELYSRMETGSHYDLIFLDIEFAKNEINGVEVGRLIREARRNYTVSIVYISQVRDYAHELFEIRPLNFLIKPLGRDAIEKTVKTYLEVTGLCSVGFSYNIGHETFKVNVKDIVCLESRDRKLIIYFSDGKVDEFYGSIKEAYNKLLKGYDFLFIHASYVVNFDFIAAFPTHKEYQKRRRRCL